MAACHEQLVLTLSSLLAGSSGLRCTTYGRAALCLLSTENWDCSFWLGIQEEEIAQVTAISTSSMQYLQWKITDRTVDLALSH